MKMAVAMWSCWAWMVIVGGLQVSASGSGHINVTSISDIPTVVQIENNVVFSLDKVEVSHEVAHDFLLLIFCHFSIGGQLVTQDINNPITASSANGSLLHRHRQPCDETWG